MMKRKKQFQIISLMQKNRLNIKLWLCVIATALVLIGGFGLNSISPNFLSIMWFSLIIFCIFKIWKWYRKKQREINIRIEKLLLFFLNSNNLFQTETIEVYKNGQTKKEKIISNSAILGYFIKDTEITIKAYKQGDSFTDKMNSLDTSICALLDLPLENKLDTISYCDYIFSRCKDQRIIIDSTKTVYNATTLLPLSSNLNWNILK